MRFLHLADVHLDTAFATRSPELRRRLRSASREALRRAVDLALAEGVDAVLIAGDLFDGSRMTLETERFLLDEMSRLDREGVPVIYATGNHDPGGSGLRAHSMSWPGNVTLVADAAPRRIAVCGASGSPVGWVTAAGHASPRETADLSREFPRPPGELPEVALLHTQVFQSRSAHEHRPYAPSSLDALRAAGYDYWALGHVHRPEVLSEAPPVHYPGNLQGRTHRERGPRGCLLVDLSDRRAPAVSFRALAPVRWETLVVEGLEGADTFEAVLEGAREAWSRMRRERPAPEGTAWIARVVLRGGCPLWSDLRREEEAGTLRREVEQALGLLEAEVHTERLHPVLHPDEHRRRSDVLGEALRLLDDVRQGRARLPGLTADDLAGFHGAAEELGEYVAGLLEDADGEVVARLLAGR